MLCIFILVDLGGDELQFRKNTVCIIHVCHVGRAQCGCTDGPLSSDPVQVLLHHVVGRLTLLIKRDSR